MYHPYKKEYSVLPNLEKFSGSPFHKDVFYEEYVQQKNSVTQKRNPVFYYRINKAILDYTGSFIGQNCDWVKPPYTFENACMQLQEDIAIHRVDRSNESDWLAATHICFPSSWRPEEKIGKCLAEIHQPIPGMNLKNSYKLAETSSRLGPFQRFVWSPIFEKRLDFHPDNPKQEFDPKNPKIYVKVEKQITWPIPEFDAFIFILRQYIVEPDLVDLYRTCNKMTPEQRAYKGISQEFLDFLFSFLDND